MIGLALLRHVFALHMAFHHLVALIHHAAHMLHHARHTLIAGSILYAAAHHAAVGIDPEVIEVLDGAAAPSAQAAKLRPRAIVMANFDIVRIIVRPFVRVKRERHFPMLLMSWELMAPGLPMGMLTWTLPADSKSSVSGNICPSRSGSFTPISMT